jgi:hypothetical protein
VKKASDDFIEAVSVYLVPLCSKCNKIDSKKTFLVNSTELLDLGLDLS